MCKIESIWIKWRQLLVSTFIVIFLVSWTLMLYFPKEINRLGKAPRISLNTFRILGLSCKMSPFAPQIPRNNLRFMAISTLQDGSARLFEFPRADKAPEPERTRIGIWSGFSMFYRKSRFHSHDGNNNFEQRINSLKSYLERDYRKQYLQDDAATKRETDISNQQAIEPIIKSFSWSWLASEYPGPDRFVRRKDLPPPSKFFTLYTSSLCNQK